MKYILSPFLMLALMASTRNAVSGEPVRPDAVDEKAELPGWPGSTKHSYPALPAKRFYTFPAYAHWALEDSKGRLWLSGERRTEEKEDVKKVVDQTKLDIELAFKEERPYVAGAEAIFEDSSGRIWFEVDVDGDVHFALGYDGKKFWECPIRLHNTGCHQNIYEDGKGRIWFMCKNSIYRLENGEFIAQPKPPGVKLDKHLLSVNTWFGSTQDGLVLLYGWAEDKKLWCFNQGSFFSITIPKQSCPLALNGGKVYLPGTDWVYSLEGMNLKLSDTMNNLVKQLNDEKVDKRKQAEKEILETGRPYREALEAFSEASKEVNIRERLSNIFETWKKPKDVIEDTVDHIQTSAQRGIGTICWMRNTDPVTKKQKEVVYWLDSNGKRLRIPVVAGMNHTMRWDPRGYPMLDHTYFTGEEYKAAVPRDKIDTNGAVQVVDKVGRVFFNRFKLEMFDPRIEEKTLPAWNVWSHALWVHANSTTDAVASFESKEKDNRGTDYVEKGDAKPGVSRRVDGKWMTIRDENQQNVFAEILFATSPTHIVIRKELADTNCWLLGLATGKVAAAGNLLELATHELDQIVPAFSVNAWGRDPQTRLTAEPKSGRVWYVGPLPENTVMGAKIMCVSKNGPLDFTAEFKNKFPGCTAPETLILVPGNQGVIAIVDEYSKPEIDKTPLKMFWNGNTPGVAPLHENPEVLKDSDNSSFLASDNKLSIGRVELKDNAMTFLKKERTLRLEFPKGMYWSDEYVKSADGLVFVGLKVERDGKTWHLPIEAAASHSAPVADSIGRVWVAVPTGLRGYKLEAEGPKLSYEIPYDRPGRTFWQLQIDQEGGAWLFDDDVNELLRISLP